jgi:hypothetical protein
MNKNRFLQVLRWQLLLSKRQIITMMLAFFGLLVIPQMIMLILKPVSDSAFSMTMFSIVFFLVYIVTCGAGIFTNLKTRQQRINDFMLPASNLEKFISRYLVLIIAIPLAAHHWLPRRRPRAAPPGHGVRQGARRMGRIVCGRKHASALELQ